MRKALPGTLIALLLVFTLLCAAAAETGPEEISFSLSHTVISPLPSDGDRSFAYTVALTLEGQPLTETAGAWYRLAAPGVEAAEGEEPAEPEKTPQETWPFTVELRGCERAEFGGIPQGAEVIVTGVPDENFLTGAEPAAAVVDGTAQDIAFVCTRKTTALSVFQRVMSSTSVDRDKTFTSSLRLFDGDREVTALAPDADTALSFPMTLRLKDGETAELDGLPVGLEYRLTAGEAVDFETGVARNAQGALTGEKPVDLIATARRVETSAQIRLTWDDASNEDGLRPVTLTATLSNDAGLTEKTVTLSSKNRWGATLTGLPATVRGETVTYTWTVNDLPAGYLASERGGEGGSIVCSHEPEQVSAGVALTWKDAEDNDALRPEEVTAQLMLEEGGRLTPVLLNGQAVTAILCEDNGWNAAVPGLKKYSAGSSAAYVWTVETLPPAYTLLESSTEAGQTALTLEHKLERVSATVKLVWNDDENRSLQRPESVKVTLIANRTAGDIYTLSAANGWTAKADNLRRFHNGDPVVYSWRIDSGSLPAGYSANAGRVSGNVTTLTTTLSSGILTVTNVVSGRDSDRRSAFQYTVTLSESLTGTYGDMRFADGKAAFSLTDGQRATAVGLPAGVGYEVTQDAVSGFLTEATGAAGVISLNQATSATFVNRADLADVLVRKVWDDDNNRDRSRPASITVRLLADGVEVSSAVLTEADGWAYTFKGLDKKNEEGAEIHYTVTEDPVEGYKTGVYRNTAIVNGVPSDGGWLIRNAYQIETTTVQGTVTWVDNDDQDGLRPDHVTVHLLADGTTVKTFPVTAENEWKFSLTELPRLNGDGKNILYSVTQEPVEGYTSDTASTEDGLSWMLQNTHEPLVTSVRVSKYWTDSNDLDHIRPDSVTVQLYTNSVPTGMTLTLSAANGWTDLFNGLPLCEGGEKIAYTVLENSVSGYTTWYEGSAETGITVVNRHQPAPTPTHVPTASPVPTATVTPRIPATGDDTPLGLWLGLALAAAAVLTTVGVLYGKKRRA